MYMVLAAQFDSFVHPFTIMLSLPLSIPFALFSLWITGRTLNLWSALGSAAPPRDREEEWHPPGGLHEHAPGARRAPAQAIVQANHVRLRPILMTTLSWWPASSPRRARAGSGGCPALRVAVTIIGGQMLCLLLTLLVTPVAYSLFEDLARMLGWQSLVRISRRGLRAARARR